MTRRKFSKEFKQQAVALLAQQGMSYKKAAEELGLYPTQLCKWKRELALKGDKSFPGEGRLEPEAEEIRRLREEVRQLKMEREILKKAAAYFAKDLG